MTGGLPRQTHHAPCPTSLPQSNLIYFFFVTSLRADCPCATHMTGGSSAREVKVHVCARGGHQSPHTRTHARAVTG